MTYSVVVLMLEATNSFSLVIPMIVAVFMSKTVADLFTSGIFMYEVREKQMPILTGACP
jgi:H+/Cl- antiporter ClcA